MKDLERVRDILGRVLAELLPDEHVDLGNESSAHALAVDDLREMPPLDPVAGSPLLLGHSGQSERGAKPRLAAHGPAGYRLSCRHLPVRMITGMNLSL